VYKLGIKPSAEKDLDRLRGETWQRVLDAITALLTQPRPSGHAKLKGPGGSFRIRIGDYRVIYDIDDGEQTVTILRVKHRRDVTRTSDQTGRPGAPNHTRHPKRPEVEESNRREVIDSKQRRP
jgi:mRNA interferase RelE/StbE